MAVFFKEGTGADEVVVMLKILSNSFSSKLYRRRTNQQMWTSSEDRMFIRNDLKQGSIALARISMQYLVLQQVLFEHTQFCHSNPGLTIPIGKALLEDIVKVML